MPDLDFNKPCNLSYGTILKHMDQLIEGITQLQLAREDLMRRLIRAEQGRSTTDKSNPKS